MSRTYDFTLGPIELNGVALPSHRAFLAFSTGLVLLWLTLLTALVYSYTFVLPQYIGFEKTLLLGVAMLVLVTLGD